ncbi:MAG: metal-dependent transcriptional regulator [Epulopiscium sp.]|nr:metal-dependent transcriptional regulator [Candidatus Epulonipiscium sp.]
MKTTGKKVTASLEDYLEAIFFLNGESQDVRVTDLAIELNISKPSVNRAINTLKSQGYVEHEHYGSLRLTEEGLRIARNMAGRHKMLKCFLIEVLNVDEDVAEEEACSIEHHLSADTIEKMKQFLDKTLESKNK